MKPIILLVLISSAIFSLPVCATAMPDREKEKDYLQKLIDWDKAIIPFDKRGESWDRVLKWFEEESGCRIIALDPIPAGSMTFINPGVQTGMPRMYSLSVVFDIINEILQGFTKHTLLRRGSDLILISADRSWDWQFPRVQMGELQHYGKTEVVEVVADFSVQGGDVVAGQIKKVLGEFGSVTPVGNDHFLVRGTVQSLMLAFDLLREAR